MLKDLNELITTKDMANLAGMNEQAVRRQCQNGTIPAVKFGKLWRIPRDLVFKTIIEKEEKELCM